MDRDVCVQGLVSWQNRRPRRAAPPISVASIGMAGCVLAGGVASTGQLLGVMHWTAPVAWVPAALLLAGVNVPVIAGIRAAANWLDG